MRLAPPAVLCPLAMAAASLLCGCTVYQAPPQRVYIQPSPAPVYAQQAPVYVEPVPQPVVSIYVEPPILQPAPILVGWAPPPMLVETVAPMPFPDAVWIGGYWVWEGNWVWAAGRWAPPPQPRYAWVHPYYENRDGAVVFITGHWSPPGVVFVPPPLSLHLALVTPAFGVSIGVRPIGPPGVFVPAPPGSRLGLIVPAPIGTPPAVVTSAAPVVNVGMRIQNNTRISNTTNVTTINNITNVTIVAPPSATANGKAFESAVPAQAHLAAALPAVVHMTAPTPISAKPIAAFAAGRPPVTLPPPQIVHTAPVGQSAAPQHASTEGPKPVASTQSPAALTSSALFSNAPGANQKPAGLAEPAKSTKTERPSATSQPRAAGETTGRNYPPQRVQAHESPPPPSKVAAAPRQDKSAHAEAEGAVKPPRAPGAPRDHERKHDAVEKEVQEKR